MKKLRNILWISVVVTIVSSSISYGLMTSIQNKEDYRKRIESVANFIVGISDNDKRLRSVSQSEVGHEVTPSLFLLNGFKVRSLATLTGSLMETAYSYDPVTDTTSYKVRYYGVWNKTPLFQSTDRISVMLAGNGSRVHYTITDSSCALEYTSSQGNETYIEDVISITASNFGSEIACDAPLRRSGTTSGAMSSLRSFTVYVEGRMQGDVTISEASARYEHRVLFVAPSFEFIGQAPSYGLGVSFLWRSEPMLTKALGSTNYSEE
ncbi:MAG: hypothetical protein A2Y20_00765 [Firmicutes bacterium GWF2_51_9]|nr:MAG: hypothetical protein A2Y20_00765 [Firmicutes bacterium GWF2_51_9]OGS58252.1 MAG: hypothetical protein A2Y19_09690 [Firmicutes bacterium GWE2_51_13]HAM64226.1 hypothetical protein [Erysipelotrichaceae bacterium]HBZ42290.1 hypothetical protein [Erysipelotrichaceae bacterium]